MRILESVLIGFFSVALLRILWNHRGVIVFAVLAAIAALEEFGLSVRGIFRKAA